MIRVLFKFFLLLIQLIKLFAVAIIFISAFFSYLYVVLLWYVWMDEEIYF
jgi:hypothetical protein